MSKNREIIRAGGTFLGKRMRVFPHLINRINSGWEKFRPCFSFHLILSVCHILNMMSAERCV